MSTGAGERLHNRIVYSRLGQPLAGRYYSPGGAWGHTLKRHLRQDELDSMREKSGAPQAKRDIKTRQQLMERSFARGTRYGFDQARWRGLWRMRIQEYLTCAIQNIQTLIKHAGKPRNIAAAKMEIVKAAMIKAISAVIPPNKPKSKS